MDGTNRQNSTVDMQVALFPFQTAGDFTDSNSCQSFFNNEVEQQKNGCQSWIRFSWFAWKWPAINFRLLCVATLVYPGTFQVKVYTSRRYIRE